MKSKDFCYVVRTNKQLQTVIVVLRISILHISKMSGTRLVASHCDEGGSRRRRKWRERRLEFLPSESATIRHLRTCTEWSKNPGLLRRQKLVYILHRILNLLAGNLMRLDSRENALYSRILFFLFVQN